MASDADKAILDELVNIKKLMMFALLKQREMGITQTDIAQVLGVSQAQVSRMLARGNGKQANEGKER